MAPGTIPLASVVIVYYKRPETIRDSIHSAVMQDYPNKEIIVVDNGSRDDLSNLIAPYGSAIKLIQFSENKGAGAGRNAGFIAAKGQFIVSSEDDVSFASPFEMSQMIKVFEENPGFHALALKICDPATGDIRLREWCHPRYWKEFSDTEFETNWFGEGASAFRREVFDACGGYYEPLFYGGPESHDLIVRMFNRGFHVLYTPRVRVFHRPAQTTGIPERRYYFFTRNSIWVAYKNYPLLSGFRFLIPKLLMMLYFSTRSRSYRPFLKGVWHGIRGLRRIKPDRTLASRSTRRHLAELEKWRPSVFVRLEKHKLSPQI